MVIDLKEKGFSFRDSTSSIVFQWRAVRPDSLLERTDAELEALIHGLFDADLEADEVVLFVLKRYLISPDRLRGLIMKVIDDRNRRRPNPGSL